MNDETERPEKMLYPVQHGEAADPGHSGNPFHKQKSKTTAVLLAVFLGPWAWLYTIALDWSKFLIGIGLFIGASVFIVLGEQAIWLLHGQLSEPQTVWELGLVASGVLLAAIYIWAIIDTARKPGSWYDDYKSK